MLFEKIQLESGESLIQVVRKHWFVIVVELFGICLLALLPLVGLGIGLTTEIGSRLAVQDHLTVISFGYALWLLVISMMLAMAWTHYYLDLWIITDRRIIVVEQVHFFHRKVGSFRLERMQDIKASVQGIIPTLLNFGTIRAQTASAAESNFTNRNLPDPRGLQSLIQRSMDARLQSLQATGSHIQNW